MSVAYRDRLEREILLALPADGAWIAVPEECACSLNDLLDSGTSLVEEKIEDTEPMEWRVRLTTAGLAARVRHVA